MNTLLRRIPSLALLCGALLFGSITPSLRASAFEASDSSEETELPKCAICMEDYDDESIIIQLDCDQAVNHHFHLSCINQASEYKNECPVCRHKNFKIHDPRVTKGSCSRVHHRHKPLDVGDQAELDAFLKKIGNPRISLKAAPDTIMKHCSTCDNDVEANKVAVQLSCGHSFCLVDAVKATAGKKSECPTCQKGPLTVIDPLQKNDKGQPVLKYLLRTPTKEESTQLTKIRGSRHVTLSQDHIPENLRVPVTKQGSTPSSKPSTPKKPSKEKPSPSKKDSPTVTPSKGGTPEVPVEFTEDFTPEEFILNYGHKKNDQPDLPIIKGTYPDIVLTGEDLKRDLRLNKQLPKHLDPRDWQVIIDEEGNLARIKRAHRLSTYPTLTGGLENVPDVLKGYSGDIIAGLCVGLLIGQDVHKADRFTPKPSWLLYGAAALGAYTLVNKANPGRTTIKPKYALRWATGVGAGILAHHVLGS